MVFCNFGAETPGGGSGALARIFHGVSAARAAQAGVDTRRAQ